MESQSPDQTYLKQKDFMEILKTGKRKRLHQARSQESKQIMSLKQGGKSVMIKEELEKGIDPKEIGNNLGLSPMQVSDARKTLRSWGIDLPRKKRDYAGIQKEIEAENDDMKLQEKLNSLSFESITSFIRNNEDQTIFTKLGNLLGEFGYTKNVSLVGEKLRADDVHIPVGEYRRLIKGEKYPQVTWIVLNKHKKRISGVAEGLYKLGQLKRKS